MLKIFCLLVALIVSTGCGKDRVDKVQVVQGEKEQAPTAVIQSSSGPNSPNIVKQGGKVTVTYAPGGPDIGDDLTPMVNLPSGQRFLYVIPKNQAKELGYGNGSENLYVTRGQSSSGITIWKSGHTPQSWEAVLYIKEN